MAKVHLIRFSKRDPFSLLPFFSSRSKGPMSECLACPTLSTYRLKIHSRDLGCVFFCFIKSKDRLRCSFIVSFQLSSYGKKGRQLLKISNTCLSLFYSFFCRFFIRKMCNQLKKEIFFVLIPNLDFSKHFHARKT